jgi:hypothetical protein
MRYLTSISLALIVHVLLSIVVLMALACTSTDIEATVEARLADFQKPEPEPPKKHTQELNHDMLWTLMHKHAQELINSAIQEYKETNPTDVPVEYEEGRRELAKKGSLIFGSLPGYNCIWKQAMDDEYVGIPHPDVYLPSAYQGVFGNEAYKNPLLTWNYIQQDDVWLITSIESGCKGVGIWTIDDNTVEIIYGRPDER